MIKDSGKQTIGWGLIGPGRFAREFADELKQVPRAKLIAVASRDSKRSADFAAEYGFKKSYDNYDALFQDDEVNIVYIVVPHVFHKALAEQAIRAGKAVLCEKPLTPSLKETSELLEYARRHNVFLMEGMKTGFLPAIRKAKAWIDAGRIGEPRLLRADFCFQGPTDPEDRLMNPDLAGGAVLDVGIYPLYLARHLLGDAQFISATGTLASTGVEESVAIITQHGEYSSAAITCSFRTEEAMGAVVQGTEGEIIIPTFHAAVQAELRKDGKQIEFYTNDSGGMVTAEIEAVIDAILTGETECSGHDHDDTRELARMMDEVRNQVVFNR